MIELTLEERKERFCKKYKKSKLYAEDLEDLDKHDIPRKVETKSKKDI